jgi:hypothetical protein
MMSLKALGNCPLDAVQVQVIQYIRISLLQYKVKKFECRQGELFIRPMQRSEYALQHFLRFVLLLVVFIEILFPLMNR